MNLSDYKGWGRFNRYLPLGLTIYLIANLIFVIYIWMQVNNRPGPGRKPDGPPPRMGNGLVHELNLTKDQQDEFKKIDDLHKKTTDSLIGNILTIKRKMVNEILKEKPDNQLIDNDLKTIGSLQESVEKEFIKLLRELNNICTPEQKEKLSKTFQMMGDPPPGGPKEGMHDRFPPMPPPGG